MAVLARRVPGPRARARWPSTPTAAGCCCPTAGRRCATSRARGPTWRCGSGCWSSTPSCSGRRSRYVDELLAAGSRTAGPSGCPRCATPCWPTRPADDRTAGRAHRAAARRAGGRRPGVRRDVRATSRRSASRPRCSTTTCTTTTSSRPTAPGGPMRVFDWGDAVVGHPFGTLLVTLRVVAHWTGLPNGAPELLRLRDAYLEPWTDDSTAPTLRRPAGWRCGSAACCGRLLPPGAAGSDAGRAGRVRRRRAAVAARRRASRPRLNRRSHPRSDRPGRCGDLERRVGQQLRAPCRQVCLPPPDPASPRSHRPARPRACTGATTARRTRTETVTVSFPGSTPSSPAAPNSSTRCPSLVPARPDSSSAAGRGLVPRTRTW